VLVPRFGNLTLDQLTKADIDLWIAEYPHSNKRINNILSPLRQVYKNAYCDDVLQSNIFDRIKNVPIRFREPQPFSSAEIERILSHLKGQERSLIKFAFWSGLRTSELVGLRWIDTDIPNDRIYVRVAVVEGVEKGTKTGAGYRTIKLQPAAKAALIEQQSHTSGAIRVFVDPKTKLPWKSDSAIRKRVWQPALRRAGVEYRSPYQTRHTFASILLSRGENPMWVAQQMGHKDWGMIRKVYGRWIQ
jgi:integrase